MNEKDEQAVHRFENNLVQRLRQAKASGTAIVAVNAPGFDAMAGLGRAARDGARPVIVQTSARLVHRHGASVVKAWFDCARKITGGEIYLHLDHCSDEAILTDCIDAGWDMVMFDGSNLHIDVNCERSHALAGLAHQRGCAVEAEVGAIGGEEDGHEAVANIADPEHIRALGGVGIDCIAVGFGNVHGDYRSKANLRWDIYEAAQDLVDVPLVLHGGSGLTDSEFLRAIRAGSAKINISTDLKKAYHAAVADAASSGRIKKDPASIHEELEAAAHSVGLRYARLFSTSIK